MARQNFSYEKRQREIAKKKKKAEKEEKKAARRGDSASSEPDERPSETRTDSPRD